MSHHYGPGNLRTCTLHLTHARWWAVNGLADQIMICWKDWDSHLRPHRSCCMSQASLTWYTLKSKILIDIIAPVSICCIDWLYIGMSSVFTDIDIKAYIETIVHELQVEDDEPHIAFGKQANKILRSALQATGLEASLLPWGSFIAEWKWRKYDQVFTCRPNHSHHHFHTEIMPLIECKNINRQIIIVLADLLLEKNSFECFNVELCIFALLWHVQIERNDCIKAYSITVSLLRHKKPNFRSWKNVPCLLLSTLKWEVLFNV